MKHCLIVIFVFFLYNARCQTINPVTIFNYQGMTLTDYIKTDFEKIFSSNKKLKALNLQGSIFIKFKIDEAGNLYDIRYIDGLNNCKPTPKSIKDNLEILLKESSGHWHPDEYILSNPDIDLLLPIIYDVGREKKSCKSDDGWQLAFKNSSNEYARLPEIEISLKGNIQ